MNAADIIAAYEFTLRQIVKRANEVDEDGDPLDTIDRIRTLAEDALAEREE